MTLIQNNAMVETLTAQRAPETFNVGILPRRFRCCFQGIDFHVIDPLNEEFTKDGISIPQEVFGSGIVGKCVWDLLSCPSGSRGMGDVEVKDAAAEPTSSTLTSGIITTAW